MWPSPACTSPLWGTRRGWSLIDNCTFLAVSSPGYQITSNFHSIVKRAKEIKSVIAIHKQPLCCHSYPPWTLPPSQTIQPFWIPSAAPTVIITSLVSMPVATCRKSSITGPTSILVHFIQRSSPPWMLHSCLGKTLAQFRPLKPKASLGMTQRSRQTFRSPLLTVLPITASGHRIVEALIGAIPAIWVAFWNLITRFLRFSIGKSQRIVWNMEFVEVHQMWILILAVWEYVLASPRLHKLNTN